MSRSNNANRPMSIDAMLDMERQEVLALLENKAQSPTAVPERMRSASPYTGAPRSPVRSMLDIAEEDDPTSGKTGPSQAPVRSMLDIDGPSVAPPPRPLKSMLDTGGPARSSSRNSNRTNPNSPIDSGFAPQSSNYPLHPRSKSDAGFRPVDFGGGPRPLGSRGNDPTLGYQFSGILSRNTGQQIPKRTSQGNKRSSGGSLGDALRGTELGGLQLPGDRGRQSSGGRLGNNKSKSPPNNRWSARSRSPATFSPLLPPNKAMLENGQVVDVNTAYRRLSDANLAFSSGSLASLPMRKQSEEIGEGRLIKDYLGPDGEHLESSDEDEQSSSDDEDRGRKKAPRALNPGAKGESGDKARSLSDRGQRQTLTLLAAADEERSKVASSQSYQYRSLIPEPEIKITNSSGDTVKPSRGGVHPHTSYDQGPMSATPSVVDSDDEADMDDIKRAQKLSFSMTNILTSPEAHRAIRIIYRGEYNKIVQAAEEENQRLRKYLVATDLSDESTHALEWAIGTVLRDGDTLIAIYCVDEETGIVTGEGSMVPDDARAMKEQAVAINTVTNTRAAPAPTSPVTEFKRAGAFHLRGDNSASSTPASSPAATGRSERSKAEEERHRAVQYMTDKVLRLLRKTRLQVRVIVEVLHCKTPRHLITEVIDLVDPTLVVIGSRGRSALKGVILGSFSNYLVTKSSVPVMVARKRLRKQSKYKRTAVRQVNNLSNPAARSLANAKID